MRGARVDSLDLALLTERGSIGITGSHDDGRKVQLGINIFNIHRTGFAYGLTYAGEELGDGRNELHVLPHLNSHVARLPRVGTLEPGLIVVELMQDDAAGSLVPSARQLEESGLSWYQVPVQCDELRLSATI
jgi:hypothetical protein